MARMKNNDVIKSFVNGATSGKNHSGNLRIEGNKLIHYCTCIAERYATGIIVNVTKYSVTTSKIQGLVKYHANRVIEVEGSIMGTNSLIELALQKDI